MQGADIAEALLPQLTDQAAEAVRAQKGAALPRREAEMGRRVGVDLPAQRLPQFSGQGVIIREGVLVHVDLPAHAAAVAAGGGAAAEIVIEIGPDSKHVFLLSHFLQKSTTAPRALQ